MEKKTIEIIPFKFDEEGTKMIETMLSVMYNTIPLFQAFRDEGIDVKEKEEKFHKYLSTMERLYGEYKRE